MSSVVIINVVYPKLFNVAKSREHNPILNTGFGSWICSGKVPNITSGFFYHFALIIGFFFSVRTLFIMQDMEARERRTIQKRAKGK